MALSQHPAQSVLSLPGPGLLLRLPTFRVCRQQNQMTLQLVARSDRRGANIGAAEVIRDLVTVRAKQDQVGFLVASALTDRDDATETSACSAEAGVQAVASGSTHTGEVRAVLPTCTGLPL